VAFLQNLNSISFVYNTEFCLNISSALIKNYTRNKRFIKTITVCERYESRFFFFVRKVEKILKGKLDLIPSPSPSVEIQSMGGKVC